MQKMFNMHIFNMNNYINYGISIICMHIESILPLISVQVEGRNTVCTYMVLNNFDVHHCHEN